MKNLFRFAALAGASLALGLSAQAGNGGINTPGSLLIFPGFDNTRSEFTLLTVTNTADGANTTFGSLGGTVKVEFVYINQVNCQEFNRTRTLTPLDTLTVVTKIDNPSQVEGYCYVFAKNPTTGKATSFNFLIGTERTMSASDFDYEVQPWVYRAAEAAGQDTDNGATPNGLLDLNWDPSTAPATASEYELVPDVMYIPRFLAQESAAGVNQVNSELILIGLSGGSQFTTLVDFLVWNDNEEEFSANHSFHCYERIPLSGGTGISSVFDKWFLEATNHNASEIQFPAVPFGANFKWESGWMRIDGNVTSSTANTIQKPAILAALIEKATFSGVGSQGLVLPWTNGVSASQDPGKLLSHSVTGN